MKKKLLRKKKQKLLKKLERRVTGYHVYRSESESLPFPLWSRITDQPIPDGSFSDPAAADGTRYFYKLTQVYENGGESAPVTPKSTYTDHAGNKFDQNPLVDLAGYNIYRSAEKDVPLEKWERRNKDPLPTTEFKDKGVTTGEVFYYFIRAVDSNGTESAPSEIMRVVRG